MAIFCIDFDQTIAENAWPDIIMAKLIIEAKEALQIIKKLGHTIIIWTCREGIKQEDARKWLIENNVPFDLINDNDAGRKAFYSDDSRKISADYYVDDRNIGYWNWDMVIGKAIQATYRENQFITIKNISDIGLFPLEEAVKTIKNEDFEVYRNKS